MKTSRILSLLLISWCGYGAIQQELYANEIGVLQGFNHVPFVLLIVLTVLAIIFESRKYIRDRKWFSFSSSIIGFLFCSYIISKLISFSRIKNKKTVLIVSNMAGATNVMRFEFKEGKKFRLVETQILDQIICYGNYKRESNNITILKSNYSNKEKKLPKFGTIKNDTVFWENFEAMLVEKPEEK
jgi:hypothetical protein